MAINTVDFVRVDKGERICFCMGEKDEPMVAHRVEGVADTFFHAAHLGCLRTWARGNPSCPFCRVGISQIDGVSFGVNARLKNGLALHRAAGHGQELEVRNLLAHGSVSNYYCGQALCAAAGAGHETIVEALLAQGSFLDEDLGRALCLAARAGHEAIVEALLAQGSFLDEDRGRALCFAAGAGHKAIVEALLVQHVPVSKGDRGRALCLAAGAGHEAIVELLFENALISERVYGLAIRSAEAGGHMVIVEMLRKQHDGKD